MNYEIKIKLENKKEFEKELKELGIHFEEDFLLEEIFFVELDKKQYNYFARKQYVVQIKKEAEGYQTEKK